MFTVFPVVYPCCLIPRTEIYVISYLLPVNGRHLWSRIYPDIYSIHSSQYLLSDPGNMGAAVWISLLSCIRAEIYVKHIHFRVNAANFDLRHTQTSNSIPISIACFMGLKTCYCRWNCAALIYISWDTCKLHYISRHLGLSDFRFHLGVLLIAPFKRLNPKTWW